MFPVLSRNFFPTPLMRSSKRTLGQSLTDSGGYDFTSDVAVPGGQSIVLFRNALPIVSIHLDRSTGLLF
jgi:hypothetical protein